ncbi:hypothetical protein Q5H92_02705 [Hymenobacter sp. M29]|uniref:CBM11 domain-containing protein n=1 Tax=Hymenobacter mellowenesis TaxID=3063995 RepID=A0ABT9A5Y3_9BACT|nr:hypothetical protein [Hymenobacter sp. M29]MDO7845251.1 hypothetical protein [Hymenobacter sp. M29]
MNNSCKIGLLAALGGLLGVAGCHPRDGRADVAQHLLVYTGFERHKAPAPAMTTEKAHTGRFAMRVDGQHRRARLYHVRLGQLSDHRPRRFTLSAWAWAPDFGADAAVVLSIRNPGTAAPALQQSMFAADAGPYQAWKHISLDVDLPNNTSPDSELTIELAANSEGPVYIDDLRLTELW